jgi:predicted alpha/beta superfamily hydrolase
VLVLSVLLLGSICTVWAGESEHTTTGNIEIIKDFEIQQLQDRNIWVYLPPDYEESTKQYPVLYMQDGQNLFDDLTAYAGEWKVDETLEKLFAEEKTDGVIVVGVNNSSARNREYNLWKFKIREKEMNQPLGEEYAEFIVNDLKPYIDKQYRTLPGREHTGIAGSSFGGTISLYIGLNYQDVFSKVAGLSASLWQGRTYNNGEGKIFDFVRGIEKKQQMKIYTDIGRKEMPGGVKAHQKLHRLLQKKGFSQQELKLVIDEDGQHKEKYWSQRFPEAFLWLFEK